MIIMVKSGATVGQKQNLMNKLREVGLYPKNKNPDKMISVVCCDPQKRAEIESLEAVESIV